MITKSKLSKENLIKIIDIIPGLVYVFNKEGRLIVCNKTAIDLYGYTAEEMMAKPLTDFIFEADHAKVMEAFQKSFVDGFAQVENRALIKDGRKIPYLGSVSAAVINGEEVTIGLGIDISELHSAREIIKAQLEKIGKLNNILEAENIYLKDQLESRGDRYQIIGNSESLKYIFFKINQVANTDATVLLEGETGTGKELIARAVHRESERKEKPFVKVNCASIPENLFESELFGHEKGAFTGAIKNHIGRYELANGGTLFLDEISELPLNAQSKLLHVLQEGEFEKVGSSKTQKSDVRIIAATNKILYDEIEKGKFREDLFYRLNVYPISVLPLRERKEDIPVLMEHFVNKYSKKFNRGIKVIPKAFIKSLMNYNWPGNIRELENVVERAIITSSNQILKNESLFKHENISNENISLEELEKRHIIKVLKKTNWKISGNGGAASILKINAETLRSKMRKLEIKRPPNR